MATTCFDLKELPARFVVALTSATAGSELLIVDNEIQVARVVPCPRGSARTPGLHPGAMTAAADFDAPLPDDFWAGAP